MTTTHYRSCTICEAVCGLAIEVDGDRIVSIRGDEADPFSKGYICPKGSAMADLHHDPDRLTKPMRRDGNTWQEMEWDEAFDYVATKLRDIRSHHGKDSIATYLGNPSAHNLGLMTYGLLLLRSLGTKNAYSAMSNDALPHMLAALHMFGNQLLMPVPDVDRTDLLICIGANPLASNGSIMTAPDMRGRMKAIRERGGRIVVLDPRRTETAEKADQHIFIRPGTDAFLLLAMINELFATQQVRLGRVPATGVEELRAACGPWTPERASTITGVSADDIRALTKALATGERAVLYGRIGVCVQEHGGVSAWLCWALNALTRHLDEPGGLMFTTPAVDPLPLSKLLGFEGGFARYKSRVSGKPEFNGELPMTALAEEILTPGEGQVRALITLAGNPVLSSPGGLDLERALGELDFMVSIDPYLNETTRFAHVILPPTSPLERSHYDLALNAYAVRNVARYSEPLFPRGPHQRHDWEICAELFARLNLPVGASLASRVLGKLGPEAIIDIALRMGPHRLSLRKLKAAVHGMDLGPLQSRIPARLGTKDRKVHLAPKVYLDDLARLDRHVPVDGLVMIGRRHLRSNNSWLHNSDRLVKGPRRCTLLMHPEDAAARGLAEGATARVATKTGTIELPVEITDAMMRGVVSVPHGWGHGRNGTKLSVAATAPGVSINDIIDPKRIDPLSGTSALNGQPVEVSRA